MTNARAQHPNENQDYQFPPSNYRVMNKNPKNLLRPFGGQKLFGCCGRHWAKGENRCM
jgi:hypothetical protein